MLRMRVTGMLVGLGLAAIAAKTQAAESIRVAVIEPLSGPPAAVGKWWANHVQFAVDQVNAQGGVLGGQKVEVVQFDSKASPAEALIVLKAVSDQGIRFVFGTAGSHIAIALSEAISKHNARNPDASILSARPDKPSAARAGAARRARPAAWPCGHAGTGLRQTHPAPESSSAGRTPWPRTESAR